MDIHYPRSKDLASRNQQLVLHMIIIPPWNSSLIMNGINMHSSSHNKDATTWIRQTKDRLNLHETMGCPNRNCIPRNTMDITSYP